MLNGLATTDYVLVGNVITMGIGSTPQSDEFYTDQLSVSYRY
jgi:hypothetical protein